MLRFALLSLLTATSPLSGQILVEVMLDQDQFLQDESLSAKVRITNRSGQTLQFGTETNWLAFSIQSRDRMEMQVWSDVPGAGGLSLASAEVATRPFDLMPYFELSEPGRYLLTARLRIKEWGQELTSAPKPFDIIRGIKIWGQEFGVPTTNGLPEMRRYILLQAHNLKQLQLYVRITDDSESRVFRVRSLGRVVSFGKPAAQVDKQSNLHVLFQAGARLFTYCVVSPEGALLTQDLYDYLQSRPVLKSTAAGAVFVSGGARRGEAAPGPTDNSTNATNAAPAANQ